MEGCDLRSDMPQTRFATLLLYLNAPALGGQTLFPKAAASPHAARLTPSVAHLRTLALRRTPTPPWRCTLARAAPCAPPTNPAHTCCSPLRTPRGSPFTPSAPRVRCSSTTCSHLSLFTGALLQPAARRQRGRALAARGAARAGGREVDRKLLGVGPHHHAQGQVSS